MIHYRCHNCGVNMESPDSMIGKMATCPACKHQVKVDTAAAAEEMPPGSTAAHSSMDPQHGGKVERAAKPLKLHLVMSGLLILVGAVRVVVSWPPLVASVGVWAVIVGLAWHTVARAWILWKHGWPNKWALWQTMIEYKCRECRTPLEALNSLAGETVSCPACGTPGAVPIPQRATMLRVLLTIGLLMVSLLVFAYVEAALPVELDWLRVVVLVGIVVGMVAAIKRLWVKMPK